jgi:large subunit ribosomal protein L33
MFCSLFLFQSYILIGIMHLRLRYAVFVLWQGFCSKEASLTNRNPNMAIPVNFTSLCQTLLAVLFQLSWVRKVKQGKAYVDCRYVPLLLSPRTIIVRLISTAQTGYFYTTQRVRQGPRLSAVKYDPKGAPFSLLFFLPCFLNIILVKQRVLFVESKKTKK